MEEADRTIDAEHPTVGVLGDASAVRSHLANRDRLEGGGAIDANPVDVIVAVGESGVGERLGLATTAPTLPVDVAPGLPSVAPQDVPAALDAILGGAVEVVERPVLGVSIGGAAAHRAVFDVTVISDRPAHISEFDVTRGGETLLETRADGVVVATPAGSHGYARAAGGVRVATGTGALAVVPVSAFATADERWITAIEPLTVSVEREGTPVQVRADDRDLGTVPGGATIEITPTDPLPTLAPPQARLDSDG